MRNLLFIVGGALVLKGFIEKYLKSSIQELLLSRNGDDLDKYNELLFSLLTSCFVGILTLSYYILSKPEVVAPQINESDLLADIMKKRRSISPKNFNDQLIDDAQINHILECANTAPTHGKTEPWRYIVYKRDTLNKLFEFVNNWYKVNGDKVFKDEEEKKKTLASIENKFGEISRASHVIMIGMKRYASEKNIMPEWEEIASVGTSVQNIYLQTAAKGFAGYWSSMTFAKHARDSKEFHDFLNLTHAEDRVFGSFVIGKTDDLSRFKRIPGDYKNKVEFR